jgi:hypothetical protein
MEGRTVGHHFERDPTRDHPCQVWFNLVELFLSRRFKCDLLSKYDCCYMARSSLPYITGFSVKFSFSQFIPIMQIRHILIKDRI